MATLEQLRATFGGDSPAETIQRAAEKLGMSPFDIADEVGVPTGRRRNAMAAGFSSGVDDLQALGYSAAAAGADAVGLTGARDWLNRRANANQAESMLNGRPDLERVEDVYDKPGQYLPYLGYQVAKQVPNLAGAVAAGALVPEVAVPTALSRAAALLPRAVGGGGMAARVSEAAATGGSEFAARRAALEAGQTFGRQVVGGGAFNYAQGVGSLYQSAVDGGNPNAGVSSLAAGIPYAVTETLPEAMLVGRLGHGSGFAGGAPSRMAKAGLTQGAAGATSELLQNEMEMAFQGNVTPEQAMSQRLNSGVAGGLVEGVLGLPGGIRTSRVRVPVKSVDQGSTDLLAPQQLGFSGYDTGVGELVGLPDGSSMLRSEFERMQRQNRGADGSYDFLPPSLSEMGGQRPAPYAYEGAIPFEEVGVPPAEPRQSQLQIPVVDDRVQKRPYQPTVDVAQALGLGQASGPVDLLQPAAPAPAQPLALTPQQQATVYAIARQKADAGLPLSLTEQTVLATRNTGGVAPALALPPDRPAFRLDGGPTPQFSLPQQEPFALTAPDSSAAGQLDLPLQPATPAPATPATAVGGQKGVTGQLPFSANAKSPKGQILQGLVESLAGEGHLDEGAKTQASTLISQGKFAAAKTIVDEALKNKTAADALIAKAAKIEEKANADRQGATEQRTGDTAAGGRVQRDGGERDAAGVQQGGADAAGTRADSGEAAPAVPANAEHRAALEGVTSEALTETADDAKDIGTYESALDELYRRWRDDGDEVASKYFEANAHVPGFSADMARVRERAGERGSAPQQPNQRKLEKTVEGKRGLKLGRQGSGELDAAAKETDDVLRGLATPKFRTREAPANGAISSEELGSVVADVQRAIPGANIEVHDNPEAAGISGPPGGDTPMGVTLKDGRVLLFRHGLSDKLEALRTAFHELFHRGLRNLLPEAEYHRMMDALYATDPEVQRRAQNWGRSEEAQARKGTMSNRQLRSLAIEEALASMAEDLKTQKPSTIRALANWFAKVAEAMGMRPLAQWLRRAQLSDAQKFILDALDVAGQEPTTAMGKTSRTQAEPVAAKFKVKNTPADDAVAHSFAAFPGAKSTLGQKIQDALFNLRESPWALKWVTNDQIAEGFKHLKPVQDINRATSRMASVANRYLETAAHTAKKWRALPEDVQLAMQRVMLKSTMDEMHVSIKQDGKYLGVDDAWKHASNNHLERDKPAVKQAFYALYREFQALPTAAKTVYDTVRDDLTRQHADTLRALRKSVADHYAPQLRRTLTDDELLALAQSDSGVKGAFKDSMQVAGTAAEIRALENLYRALRDLNADFGTVRGPYFPLVRFGDQVVVMKSADLVDLEMHAQSLRLELQKAMDAAPAAADAAAEAHDAQVAEIRKRYNDALKAVAAAKQDEKKYIVEFHETPAQAERARAALAEKYPAADVYRSVRENYFRALDGASPAFLNDLTTTLAAALDAGDGVSSEAKSAALQAMRDMYLRRQPERSALRSELKRMTVEGVQSAQMLRGYAQASRSGAWRISRLLHAGEVTQGLASLSEDRRSADAKHVLNELKARFVGDIAPPEDNKWLQRLQGATYFMHLGFNISYFTTNATQAWLISLPVMGGRHGVVNSANSLMAASKDVIRLLSQATAKSIEENGAVVGLQLRLSDEQINSLAQNEGEAKMLKALTDDGVIDITIKHDLGAISDGTSNSMPGKLMEISSALANYPELYNRLSTALAAYRMESARREGGAETAAQVQERAQAYAENIINRTHFNYSPENAPRMMRGQLGRLVFQFKRYQQGMIYLFAKLIRDSSNGDADARRSLAYLLGATTAVGGVAALPIAAPFALAAKLLASMYPDDDEPDWLQQWYNGMKDGIGESAAQAIAKGLPTAVGLDLSKKLGAGDLLNPVAFARVDGKKTFSRDYWTEVGFALLGPGASLLADAADAVGAAKDGQYLRAAEKGMPTFIANALKAFDRASDGLSTKQGDTIMEPEEFGALATAAKALGFESVEVSDTYDNRSSYMQSIEARKQARQGLMREYYEAVKSGDSDRVNAAREAINDFNTRQPADRVRGSDLSSSIKQHAQRARETHEGLRVGKRDTDTYNRLLGR